ncbi:MAG: RNA polymerase sigma-70 factor [Balneolaceae bacterium]
MLLFAYLGDNKDSDAPIKELECVAKIRAGDEQAFEELFFEYYNQLSKFANTITKSREYARDTVQDVFLKIWRNRANFEIRVSIKVYLYQAVRNQALNLLEKQKTRQRLVENIQHERGVYESYSNEGHNADDTKVNDSNTSEAALIRRVWELVEQMPERRRLVFELHRKHGLSYKEIAKVLEIAPKTVENHVGQALQFIRDHIDIKKYDNS